MVFAIFVGEVKTWLLQAYYKDLWPELTFKLWWFSFYLDNLGIFFLKNFSRDQSLVWLV